MTLRPRYLLSLPVSFVVLSLVITNPGCGGGPSNSAPPAKTLTSISVKPTSASIAVSATQQFTATGTYSDHSTANVSSTASWTALPASVATASSSGLATGTTAGSTAVSASINGISASAALIVTAPAGGVANIVMWHFDAQRTGLNPNEASLSPATVTPQTFGKLFSYLLDGYEYGQPLLVSNLTINGGAHNVVFAATENDSVYAFDADNYGSGAPLWQVSLLQPGETPIVDGPIQPFQGITSTPVIDTTSNTTYVVSTQTLTSTGVSTFRLNALDITTGKQKFGGPMTLQASVPGTNSDSVNGVASLTTSCVQRAALLLANSTVYIGFGGCHSGWLLAYDAQSLAQTGVFNASPNQNGEGTYASAGGIWMGGGGPAADDSGNVYVTTGNGPWDGQTAWGDSVLKFANNGQLQLVDYFTPDDYRFMNCHDADLASGGLLLIPGGTEALAAGKTGKLYLVNTTNLGKEQANDAGATQTVPGVLSDQGFTPYPASCTDTLGTWTTDVNSYEIFSTASYFNGSIYVGITPTATAIPVGIVQFQYSGTLTPLLESSPAMQLGSNGATAFISANGTANGILWIIDHGEPLQNQDPNGAAPTTATLRAYDTGNLDSELYDSGINVEDAPGYGIKFTSPIVANGKVYIGTGHDLTTVPNPRGELDVYGSK
jgi:Bacterial Ig-like domain (group 2)